MSRKRWSVAALAAVVAGTLAMGLAPAARSVILLPADSARHCAWPVVYPGVANYAWPDTHASYINQAVVLGPQEKAVITGRDPKARYWSITTYNYQDRQVIDRVNDATVRRSGKGARATWAVTVSPKQNTKDPNSLQGAPAYTYGTPLDLQKVTVIMYRVYLPATGGYSGGALPTITLFHDDGTVKRTEKLVACTGEQIGPPDQPLGLDEAVGLPADTFIRAEGGRFYPSYDTAYLAAEVPYDPERILVVTGRAPRVTADVRYWSLCQNVNKEPLPVVDCVSDADVKLTKGRYTIAVASSEQVPLSDRGKYPGVTFVDWGDLNTEGSYENAMLIVRHILPSPKFAYSIAKVALGQPASTAMGEYAPIISEVPLSELSAS